MSIKKERSSATEIARNYSIYSEIMGHLARAWGDPEGVYESGQLREEALQIMHELGWCLSRRKGRINDGR